MYLKHAKKEAEVSIRKDKIVIVDLESTCWEGYTAPVGQTNEIIEIGICLLDVNDLSIEKARSLLVRPIESVVSPFCTQLTSITPDLLQREGIDFTGACEIVERDYDSRNRLWASWGAYDYEMFWAQCKRRQVRYPFSKKHANLKRVFQQTIGERMGTESALAKLEIEFEGTRHRGVDDAYNTARILTKLIQAHGLGILRKYGL